MTNLLDRMSDHPYVKVKETLPGVFACNFTRQAFYKLSLIHISEPTRPY